MILIDRKLQAPPVTKRVDPVTKKIIPIQWLILFSPVPGKIGNHIQGYWDIAYWDGNSMWMECGTELPSREESEGWTHWALLEKPL